MIRYGNYRKIQNALFKKTKTKLGTYVLLLLFFFYFAKSLELTQMKQMANKKIK